MDLFRELVYEYLRNTMVVNFEKQAKKLKKTIYEIFWQNGKFSVKLRTSTDFELWCSFHRAVVVAIFPQVKVENILEKLS